MAAFTASQAKVDNGSKVVQINSGESVSNVRGGDFLVIANAIVEINHAYIGADNKGYFELVKNWPNSNQSNQPCIVIPTTGEFKTVVTALHEANALVNDNYQAMQAWQTQMGTVTFVNKDKTTTTVKTLKQIENEAQAQLDEYHPYPWAMRKVEFEARRAANNEKFAASGFVSLGKSLDSSLIDTINQGLQVSGASASSLVGQLALGFTGSNSKSGNSKTDQAVINIAGVLTNLIAIPESYGIRILLPPAEDGTRTYDSTTGLSITHATSALAFAAESATNKVVTDRVDLWGFEVFLREINDADPFVYKYGLPQSLASSINGVATVDDNIRPITYFAWYTGDTTSRGKGVNWQNATEAQRINIASDPENNIYFDDLTGKFYQWCVMGRSYAGVKNGDWFRIDTTKSPFLMMTEENGQAKYIYPKGKQDTVPTFRSGWPVYQNIPEKTGLGVFKAFASSEAAPYTQAGVEGECYFYVGGTVNRRNTGLHHDSLNTLGTAKASDDKVWHNTAQSFTSKADCFDSAKLLAGSGSIASGKSGAPDGRYYDAIYESGQGGVCRDMRYLANKLTDEDFQEHYKKVLTGDYRGTEKLSFSKFIPETVTVSGIAIADSSNSGRIYFGVSSQDFEDQTLVFNNLQKIKVYLCGDNNQSMVINIDTYNAPTWWPNGTPVGLIGGLGTRNTEYAAEFNNKFPVGTKLWIGVEYAMDVSISHEFTHSELVGSAQNILSISAFHNGWCGKWNPNVPDGVKSYKDATFTRIIKDTSVDRIYTTNGGASWAAGKSSASLDTNSMVSPTVMSPNLVEQRIYSTNAKMTLKATNDPVYKGNKGLGKVFVSAWASLTKGKDLGYSLIDKVLTGTNTYARTMTYNLVQGGVDPNSGGLPISASYPIKHPVVDISVVDSPAFKALDYQVSENSQGFINFAFTELANNGVDWGDDGLIHPSNTTTSMPDENGRSVLVSTARCTEPLGWI